MSCGGVAHDFVDWAAEVLQGVPEQDHKDRGQVQSKRDSDHIRWTLPRQCRKQRLCPELLHQPSSLQSLHAWPILRPSPAILLHFHSGSFFLFQGFMSILISLMSTYIIMVKRELCCVTSKWCFFTAGTVLVRGKKDWGDHAAAARVFASNHHDIRQPQRGLRHQAEQGRGLLQQQAQCHFSGLAEQALWP